MANVATITRGEELLEFETLSAAFAGIESGDVVTLVDSCEGANIAITTKVTLDLAGHVITGKSNKCVFNVQPGGNLTVLDSSEVQVGEIIHQSQSGIYLSNTEDVTKRPVFTLQSGTITAQEFGVYVFGACVVNIEGGTVISKDNAGLGANGSKQYAEYPYEINVYGGNVFANTESAGYANCAIYHANAGEVNISGGNIVSTAGAGVVVRAGDIKITGGTISGQGNSEGLRMGDANPTYCGGVELCNAANYPGKMGACLVAGGEILSSNNYGLLVIGNPEDYANASSSQCVVTSGSVKGGLGAIGFVTKENEPIEDTSAAKLTVVGGSFNSDVAAYVDSSVNLSVEYDENGNAQYVIKDGMKAVLAYLDDILDKGTANDEAELELLNQIIDSISSVENKEDASNESLEAIKDDLAEAKQKIADIITQLEDEATSVDAIKNTAEGIKESVDSTNEAVSAAKTSVDKAASDVRDVKDEVNEVSTKLDNIKNLQKKAVEELAKLNGDDISEIVDEEDPKTAAEIELMSVKALIGNAMKTGETRAIWQHPMTKNVRDYLDKQGYAVSRFIDENAPARLGDQWLIVFE